MSNFQSGALLDTRLSEEKERDYTQKEIVASISPVNWVEKPQSQWRKFPIFNQNGSGSCVAQTLAKIMGVMYWLINGVYVHFSATHIYQRRNNKPQPGMAGVEAFDIARDGVTLEELVPSQNLTDEQMDGVMIAPYKEDVGKIFALPKYVQTNIQDIDTIASTIQATGKAVMVWFYFNIDEWTEVPTIKYPELTALTAQGRHSVAAVDFTMYQGKKALIIEDSWGTSYGMAGQRVITEDFFKVRNFFAAYPINFRFQEPTPVNKPSYTFTVPLTYGQQNIDITGLQNILKYEGMFPGNADSTGYYGEITRKGVLAFQQKYAVDTPENLAALNGKRVGSLTIKKLNELYGK